MDRRTPLLLLFCLLPMVVLGASSPSPDFPVYITELPHINDYTLFANGGWDGNWYVGFNNGWVKKLPPAPKGAYAKAYLGAKLGRMKTLPPVGRPPQFHAVPGDIWMAISSTSAWRQHTRVRLTATDSIPLEGHSEYAIEGVGESQWFWTEIPMNNVHFTGDNYLLLWSTSSNLMSVSSSPVLAAGWGGKEINTWVVKDLHGDAPQEPTASIGSGLSYFQPAMGIKLIPAGPPHPVRVRVISWHNGTPSHLKPVVTATVEGESIERAWVEFGVKDRWSQAGRAVWQAPYSFTVEHTKLPAGRVRLRVAAANIWEEVGYSQPFEVEVGSVQTK